MDRRIDKILKGKEGKDMTEDKISVNDLKFIYAVVSAFTDYKPSAGSVISSICGLIDRKFYPHKVDHMSEREMIRHMDLLQKIIKERW